MTIRQFACLGVIFVSLHAETRAQGTSNPPASGLFKGRRTVESSVPFQAITARQKFYIGAMDSVDVPAFLLTGTVAGYYQLVDRHPSFEQGLEGYGKRYGAAFADQASTNMMVAAVLPSLLHQDPRYFRLGTGTAWQRTRYALTRIFLTRNDQGRWTFNYSEWLGSASAVSMSNLYYPPESQTAAANSRRFAVQVGAHAMAQVFKEFWPDWKRKLTSK